MTSLNPCSRKRQREDLPPDLLPWLQPSSKGWRIKYSGEKRTVIDGPFTETKELIAGYTLIQVKSKEEAMEWARRFPNTATDGKEGEIEVRVGAARLDLRWPSNEVAESGDLAISRSTCQ